MSFTEVVQIALAVLVGTYLFNEWRIRRKVTNGTLAVHQEGDAALQRTLDAVRIERDVLLIERDRIANELGLVRSHLIEVQQTLTTLQNAMRLVPNGDALERKLDEVAAMLATIDRKLTIMPLDAGIPS